jgi:hypothetical protein
MVDDLTKGDLKMTIEDILTKTERVINFLPKQGAKIGTEIGKSIAGDTGVTIGRYAGWGAGLAVDIGILMIAPLGTVIPYAIGMTSLPLNHFYSNKQELMGPGRNY